MFCKKVYFIAFFSVCGALATEVSPTTAQVLGEVQDGTPPPLQPPKPGFVIPAEDIISTEIHIQDGRKIIVQEISPIALPAPTVDQPVIDQAHPAIQSIHDVYNNEFERLKTAYDSREQARLQQAAELKAHPPIPKDIILNFWRTETPNTRTSTGGADQ